ncbi:MAG: 16S rRNA (cytosine(1402)-N(4))-methyltransferase RsmH [Candidatus Omnitrophica bacterium]|nr:16S rRNA (cytosine(1402)-N(4))-methyltransferase RsmH [Candidatus Omnitrophota bacterium]
MTDIPQPHKRRPRYQGKHPRRFEEKYKEHNPEKYGEVVQKVIEGGKTPAGTHRPIMVDQVLNALDPQQGHTGIDATLGYGGHAVELLKRILPDGKLFALDADPVEIVKTGERLRKQGYSERELVIRRFNFAGILKLLGETDGGFDFILADLGVSSMQLDNPARGFSYKHEGPLDLRLNPEKGQPASALIQKISEDALAEILRCNSDEPHSEAIAKAICENRKKITTTTALTQTVEAALLAGYEKPETEITRSIRRVFQALRIEVNDEFSALEQFLRNLPFVLKSGGRVVVLSFHSGEDSRVEKAFTEGLAAGVYGSVSFKAETPDAVECYANPRAKSTLLRWAQKA